MLLLVVLALGWRAVALATKPFPSAPPFQAPWLADRALLARFDPFFPARADSGEGLPVTALPFTLHGVRADSATGRGSAIIAGGDGMQKVYAVGETLADGVSLAAIAADHVVLERGGTREALWLDSGGGEAVQRFDPGPPPPPPGMSRQQAGAGNGSGEGLTPENAPPSVMPGDEDEQPAPARAVRQQAQQADEPQP
ncbi:hypothetical protein FJQ54_06130 [Sandaracinobacter neustonicus]|uniref:Type II secretion system protein GspC N-terminal domain-containing protein n=1 Tax=Sandaracinobacter neustonicus TaxID=1715348 RepID=A0A501XQ01_9SPHN|nr:hypothetical protein FJQ54_06130 [Sandaracinobacter neustonicus]